MSYYDVALDDQHFTVEASSPAIANRMARDLRNKKVIDLLAKIKLPRDQALFFERHKHEIVGPRTAVVVRKG